MSSKERLVIIGADAAGMSAASQARRLNPNLDIVAFERGGHTSYSACGMPYFIGGLIDSAGDLIARTPGEFRKMGIDARIFHEVMEIDLDARVVRGRYGEGEPFTEDFDQLVIATGAAPIWPKLPGSDAAGIYGLSSLGDGIRVRQVVLEEKPKTAVIVGGGYIGIEMAEALMMRGVDVTIVELAPQVLSLLDPDMAGLVAKAIEAHGVTLLLNERALGFEVKDGAISAVGTEHRTLPADIVIMGIGVQANSELARAAGLAIGAGGAIAVNNRLQTSHDGVWAAGDCAESFHLVSQRRVHVALGTVANKHGRICGTNIGGGYAVFPGVVGTAITKIGETEIARTGLNEREAAAEGIEFVTGSVTGTVRAGYYPSPGEITVKVLAEREYGRLLGAQIVGSAGAGKRIDVFATALHARMSVEEMQFLDLSYAPPVGPTWDTPMIAVRRAAEALRR